MDRIWFKITSECLPVQSGSKCLAAHNGGAGLKISLAGTTAYHKQRRCHNSNVPTHQHSANPTSLLDLGPGCWAHLLNASIVFRPDLKIDTSAMKTCLVVDATRAHMLCGILSNGKTNVSIDGFNQWIMLPRLIAAPRIQDHHLQASTLESQHPNIAHKPTRLACTTHPQVS